MTRRLLVDPTRCDGVGICAITAPDLISLDVWGFPLVSDESLSDQTMTQAERAVKACPKKALLIFDEDAPTS